MSNIEKIVELSKRLGEPEWLLSWRKQAAMHAEKLPRHEKYGIGISAIELHEEPLLTAFPEYSVDASKGLELYTWKEAMGQEEIAPILERLLTSELLPTASSKEQSLGRGFFQTGLIVYVQPSVDEEGAYKEESLTLTTTLPLGATSDMIIVIAKEGAQLRMQSVLTGGESSSALIRTVITLLEGESKVSLNAICDDVRGFVSVEHKALVSSYSAIDILEDPSRATTFRSDTSTLLLGQNAASTITHIVTAEDASQFDIHALTRHQATGTTSQIYALGTAGDTSRTVYRAAIDIESGIQHVRGAQEGKFLILSDGAEVDAIPMLDIASNEVSSTHKLSVSHIRDEDMFYAKSRGLSLTAARALILEGFFGALLEKLGKPEILASLEKRLERLVSIK